MSTLTKLAKVWKNWGAEVLPKRKKETELFFDGAPLHSKLETDFPLYYESEHQDEPVKVKVTRDVYKSIKTDLKANKNNRHIRQKAIAYLHGVSQPTVSKINRSKNYKEYKGK